MKIKDGYGNKETEISVIASRDRGTIELWVIDSASGRETLSYLTPTELYELFKEVRGAARELFGS